MRQKPKEFGLGVRDVQASPVDTFSPEVVMQPRAARGGAVGEGLQQLSQTLAGMGQQNRQFDEKTLEPLAEAVHAMKQDGKSDAEITKEVSEAGLTTGRVLNRIRKAGGYDAFSDLAFRVTYDELEADSAYQSAQSSLNVLDKTARNLASGYGLGDDPEELRASLFALYGEGTADHKSGLSPLSSPKYDKLMNAEIARRVDKAFAAGQRTQEVDIANKAASSLSIPLDQHISGVIDGAELTAGIEEVFKGPFSQVSPQDIPAFLTTTVDSLGARLEVAVASGALEVHESQEDIEEIFTAFEEGLPEDVLDANPDALNRLRKLQAKYTRNDRQIRQYREAGGEALPASVAENIALRELAESSGGDIRKAWTSEETVRDAASYVMDIQARLGGMPEEDRQALAERLGVDASQVGSALSQLRHLYTKRADEIKRTGVSDLNQSYAESQRKLAAEDRSELKEHRSEAKKDKLSSGSREAHHALIAAASGDPAKLAALGSQIALDSTLSENDRTILEANIVMERDKAPLMRKAYTLTTPAVESVAQSLMEGGLVGINEDAEITAESAGRFTSRVQLVADDVARELMQDPEILADLEAGRTGTFLSELRARLPEATKALVFDEYGTGDNSGLSAVNIRPLVTTTVAGLTDLAKQPLVPSTMMDSIGSVLEGADLSPETDAKEYSALVSATNKGFKGTYDLGAAWLTQPVTTTNERGPSFSKTSKRFMDAVEPLLEQAKSDDIRVSQSAQTALRTLMLNSGSIPMSAEGVFEFIQGELMGPTEGLDEVASWSPRTKKLASRARGITDALIEYAEFDLEFTSWDEASRYRAPEFNTDGVFGGLYNSTTGDLNTSKKFTVLKGGVETEIDFSEVVNITQKFLGDRIRGFTPSRAQTLDWIYRQSAVTE